MSLLHQIDLGDIFQVPVGLMPPVAFGYLGVLQSLEILTVSQKASFIYFLVVTDTVSYRPFCYFLLLFLLLLFEVVFFVLFRSSYFFILFPVNLVIALVPTNELWTFFGGNWTFVSGTRTNSAPGNWGSLKTPNANNVPSGRSGSASYYDGQVLWLFGGYGKDENGNTGTSTMHYFLHFDNFLIFDPSVLCRFFERSLEV